MSVLHPAEAIVQLDAIGAGDPERAHMTADEVLLAAAPPAVRDAYLRVGARCRWWAYS